MELLWQINKNLEEISVKIDRLISFFEFSQKQQLMDFKEKALGRSEVRREIYGLCDGTKTVQDIAKRVGKSVPHISQELSILEEAGLIVAREAGRKRYYMRVV